MADVQTNEVLMEKSLSTCLFSPVKPKRKQTPTDRCRQKEAILRNISSDTDMSLSMLFSFTHGNYTKQPQLILLAHIDLMKMLHRASSNIYLFPPSLWPIPRVKHIFVSNTVTCVLLLLSSDSIVWSPECLDPFSFSYSLLISMNSISWWRGRLISCGENGKEIFPRDGEKCGHI